jgi:AraC family transcriptional regulator
MGEYIRKLRVEKSFALLAGDDLSLTDIAFACGFADQSHFLRCFKQFGGSNPSAYRKLLLRAC